MRKHLLNRSSRAEERSQYPCFFIILRKAKVDLQCCGDSSCAGISTYLITILRLCQLYYTPYEVREVYFSLLHSILSVDQARRSRYGSLSFFLPHSHCLSVFYTMQITEKENGFFLFMSLELCIDFPPRGKCMSADVISRLLAEIVTLIRNWLRRISRR